MLLTRKEMLAGRCCRRAKVDLEGGDWIYVREVTAGESMGMVALIARIGKAKAMLGWLFLCACDVNGVRCFTDEVDIDGLMVMPFPTVTKIATAAMAINGITEAEDDVEADAGGEEHGHDADADADPEADPDANASTNDDGDNEATSEEDPDEGDGNPSPTTTDSASPTD